MYSRHSRRFMWYDLLQGWTCKCNKNSWNCMFMLAYRISYIYKLNIINANSWYTISDVPIYPRRLHRHVVTVCELPIFNSTAGRRRPNDVTIYDTSTRTAFNHRWPPRLPCNNARPKKRWLLSQFRTSDSLRRGDAHSLSAIQTHGGSWGRFLGWGSTASIYRVGQLAVLFVVIAWWWWLEKLGGYLVAIWHLMKDWSEFSCSHGKWRWFELFKNTSDDCVQWNQFHLSKKIQCSMHMLIFLKSALYRTV